MSVFCSPAKILITGNTQTIMAHTLDFLRRVHIRCGEFLTNPVPLYKTLSSTDNRGLRRVKVRQRNNTDPIVESIVGQYNAKRAVMCTTKPATEDDYYVFPVNGAVISMYDRTRSIIPSIIIHNIPDFYAISIRECQSFDNLIDIITSTDLPRI